MLWVVDEEVLEDLSHQGILAHENLSSSTHLFAGLVHLLRANIVDFDDEHFRVGPEKSLFVTFIDKECSETFSLTVRQKAESW